MQGGACFEKFLYVPKQPDFLRGTNRCARRVNWLAQQRQHRGCELKYAAFADLLALKRRTRRLQLRLIRRGGRGHGGHFGGTGKVQRKGDVFYHGRLLGPLRRVGKGVFLTRGMRLQTTLTSIRTRTNCRARRWRLTRKSVKKNFALTGKSKHALPLSIWRVQ